jgi:hypothetical protein
MGTTASSRRPVATRRRAAEGSRQGDRNDSARPARRPGDGNRVGLFEVRLLAFQVLERGLREWHDLIDLGQQLPRIQVARRDLRLELRGRAPERIGDRRQDLVPDAGEGIARGLKSLRCWASPRRSSQAGPGRHVLAVRPTEFAQAGQEEQRRRMPSTHACNREFSRSCAHTTRGHGFAPGLRRRRPLPLLPRPLLRPSPWSGAPRRVEDFEPKSRSSGVAAARGPVNALPSSGSMSRRWAAARCGRTRVRGSRWAG